MKLFENKEKKILAIGSICVLALLSACGDDNSDFATQPSGDSSSSVKEITVISSSSRDDKSSSSSVKSSSSSSDSGPAEVTEGSLIDSRDGQTYKTVTIGTQTWMAQNLNYETENSYCYLDIASNCTEYGRLYTWAAAMDSAGTWSTNGKGCGYNKTCSPAYPVRGVCPEGWHLPTQAEWNALVIAVGGSSTAGKVLRSQTGWSTTSQDVDGNGMDAYAFSALPAGHMDAYRGYGLVCYYVFFWSSTEYDCDDDDAYYMVLYYAGDSANLYNNRKKNGYSVRCVKN